MDGERIELTPEQRSRVDAVLAAVLEVPASERSAKVASFCSDPAVLAEVEALLARVQADDASTRLVARDVVHVPSGIESHVPRDAPVPDRIGSFSIKKKLDEGGMGAVYLAMQENPRRTVALKVMQRGIASRSALRRFEYESQILARLRHPNIAQVIEAGTHDDGSGGVPYFAMEYVPNARSLTAYATTKKLSTRERLELFAKVCDAVHHGHQKGIVHRDLKPGNILVDSEGEPKIIDFGVARATDSDLAVTTLQTDVGQLIGTLQYMSPEQCEADPHDLDTRSDVYSLGVVLYELLCGQVPYEVSRAAIHEAARVIREEEPARPSTMNRTLRGDVETITLKALEKDRRRRYQSAADLSQDIERYLANEPIEARPPSVAYQLERFARRHRPLVIGAAMVFLVLVAGIVATSLVLARALRAESLAGERLAAAVTAREAESVARAEAQQRAAELERVVEFQAEQLSGIDVQLMGVRLRRELLAEARAAMERSGLEGGELNEHAVNLEELLAGTNFTDLALHTLDENIFASALTAVEEQFDDHPLVKASLLQTLATTLLEIGLLEAAMAPQRHALDIRRQELADEHPDTLSSISSLAGLLLTQGKLSEAEPYYREALEGYRRTLGDDHPDTLTSINNMGVLLEVQGKLSKAEAYYREALEGHRRTLGDDHPHTLSSIHNMGFVLRAQGKLSEAEPYLREGLEGYRRTLGDDHPQTLSSINSMGVLLQARGKLSKAEAYYRDALEGRRRTLGDEHPYTLISIHNMGVLLEAQGKLSEAEAYYRDALEGRRRTLGDDHPHTLISINDMGSVLQAQGKLSEAEAYSRDALEGRRRVLGDEHPSTLISINSMGGLLNAQGRYAESEPLLRESLETGGTVLGGDNWRVAEALSLLGEALVGLERFEEAETLLLEGHTALETALPPGRRPQKLPPAAERLVRLYEQWGKSDQAAVWQAKLAPQPEDAVGESSD